MHLALTKTRFGLNVLAVGGSAEAAKLSGVNVRRVQFMVLSLSGLLSAFGGVILAARLGAGTGTVGEALLLDSIAAVVIGGTSLFGGVGTILGTAIGVILIASIRNGLVLLGVSAFWQLVAIGVLILFAVFVDYAGKGRMGRPD
jgi:ribose/xylose/arabinose/galactoside ABC-type transport system permease subunit